MSYELYDAGGYLGRVASIEGWGEVVDGVGQDGTELGRFVKHGFSKDPPGLKSAIEAHLSATTPLDQELKQTLKNLSRLVGQAKEVVILAG